MGLWGRVAPLLTPWCSLRELPTGVNLNRYAGCGSSIPWHGNDEPLFGDQSDPKVIASMSLGSSVDFRVRSRVRRNAPSSIRLNRGDLLVMDGPNRSMSIQPHPSCKGPGSTLRTDGYHSTPRPTRAGACCPLPSCAQGLPGLGRREGGGGISDAAFGVVFPLAGGRCVPRTGVRLDCPLGVASPASLPCLSLLFHSGATCFFTRTGALDWEETVENAAAAWTVPTVDLEIPF